LLIKEGVENKYFLNDRQKMTNLKEVLQQKHYKTSELTWSAERDIYELTVTQPLNSWQRDMFKDPEKYSKPVKISKGLIYAKDYQNCLILDKKIKKFDHPPFEIFSPNNETDAVQVPNKKQLLSYLMEAGKKGIGIQRYKGLGEMNPEQLWSTTMDPEKRTLLKVKVADALEADEIFTVLMGEEVEPRRDFIQNNALEVSRLDI